MIGTFGCTLALNYHYTSEFGLHLSPTKLWVQYLVGPLVNRLGENYLSIKQDLAR